MKAYKRLWVTCRELQLRFYKSREDAQHSSPLNEFSLRGCEVTPDVNLAQGKFVIKLEVPAADGMSEMFLRCENVSGISEIMISSIFFFFLIIVL